MLSKAVAVKTIDLDLMCCVGIVNVDTGVMKVFRAKKRNTFGTYVKKICNMVANLSRNVQKSFFNVQLCRVGKR